MKIPQAKQLPSGTWYARVVVNGERISITGATKAQVERKILSIKSEQQDKGYTVRNSVTLRGAIDEYIDRRSVSLSPSTVRGYRIIQKNRFADLMDEPLSRITEARLQRSIDEMSKRLSAKTIRNSVAFIESVLRDHKMEYRLFTPTLVREERDFLDTEEIARFLAAIVGAKHEVAMILALHGLRASEILDVKWRDIDLTKKTITVAGAAVLDETNRLVHKAANKNSSSRRVVPILIEQLTDAVMRDPHESEYVFPVSSGMLLTRAVWRGCDRAGIRRVSAHELRHSFVSAAYSAGLSELLTMQLGGYSDYNTMRRIYTHLAKQDKKDQLGVLKNVLNKRA